MSIGDISRSKIYVAIWRTWEPARELFIGPTYHGTKYGIVGQVGRIVFMAHVR